MSMLSAQCGDLRSWAMWVRDHVDHACGNLVAQEMEKAADTIWDLRNKCVELRKDSDLHKRLAEEYLVNGIERQRVVDDDNDGLRQLCKDMYLFMVLAESFDMLRISAPGKDDLTMDEFRRRMAKHGIEVGE